MREARKFSRSNAKTIEGTRYTGNVDGVFGTQLCGWVMDVESPDATIEVGLVVDGEVVQTAMASESRQDLDKSGTGPHAFTFYLESLTSLFKEAESKSATVWLLDDPDYCLGTFGLGGSKLQRSDPRVQTIRKLAVADFVALETALSSARPKSESLEPALPLELSKSEATIFSPVESSDNNPGPNAPALSRYQVFVAQRFQQRFGLERHGEDWDQDRFFDWYLFHYSQMRRGLRVPLSQEQIHYLNNVMVFGRAAFNPTRAMMYAITREKSLFATQDYETLEGYERVCYWWAVEAVRVLFCEDCLVTDEHVSVLSRTVRGDDAKPYPLSVFLRLFAESNGLDVFLKFENEQDRALLYFVAVLHAVRSPDIMRFIPKRGVEDLFSDVGKAGSSFCLFLNTAFVPEAREELRIELDDFVRVLAELGYSFTHGRFNFKRVNGNRMNSLSTPRAFTTRAKPSPVQIIGPISKSSGLGQAARSSAKILDELGIEYSTHDFELDDPGTRIRPDRNTGEFLQPAQINLIHLNAESIPLLVPYAQDMLRNSYNIGFPFWELDHPADCHKLGLDLVDELWLGSQFCTDVFGRGFSGLTTTMGLAVEPTGLDKKTTRVALRRRLALPSDAFVVLAMFDAYSYVERKNPLAMIRAFQTAFPADESAHLVIKTQHKAAITDARQSEVWRAVDRAVSGDHRIHLVDEALDSDKVGTFIAAADCFLSLHRAEGFGLGMLEAMVEGVPVVATNYSGNTDFTTEETAFLVGYKLRHLAPEDYIYARPEHSWAEPDLQEAAKALQLVRKDGAKVRKVATAAQEFARDRYSIAAVAARYAARLEDLL